MNRLKKLSHTVWTLKYRLRILEGAVATEAANCIRMFSEQKSCEVVELNVQIDHVHLVVLIPPKISLSDYMCLVKKRTAIRVFNRFRELKQKSYWGNDFGARGYCVDTGGLDENKVRKYVELGTVKLTYSGCKG